MSTQKFLSVLRAMRKLSNLLGRGERHLLSQVTRTCKLSRSTTYRYLVVLERGGFVDREAIKSRGRYCDGWNITMKGMLYVKENF